MVLPNLVGLTRGQAQALIDAALDPLTTLDLFEDFISGNTTSGQIGALGLVFGNGTVAGLAGEANHPGILRRDTTAIINTVANTRHVMTTDRQFLAAEAFDVTWVFRLNTNDADTVVEVGLSSNWTVVAPVDAIYLEKKAADTQWFGTARASSAESRTAALATVDTGWHRVRIRRIDASTVGFTLDAGPEVTLATNVPTAGVTGGALITNTAAAAKTLDLDLYRLRLTGLVR